MKQHLNFRGIELQFRTDQYPLLLFRQTGRCHNLQCSLPEIDHGNTVASTTEKSNKWLRRKKPAAIPVRIDKQCILEGLQHYLTIIATVASVIFVGWALLTDPTEKGTDETVGKQLTGIIGTVILIAVILGLAILVLPFIGMAALVVLSVFLGAVLVFILWKVLRPLLRRLFPSLKKLFGFLKRQTVRIARWLWQIIRAAGRIVGRIFRFIVRPERWRKALTNLTGLVWRLLSRLRRIGASVIRSLITRPGTGHHSSTRQDRGQHA